MATYTIPTTKARIRFLSMVRDSGASFARYVITCRGKPEAVMMSAEEFEGWLETLEIAQSPTWRRALARARREDRKGLRLRFDKVTGRRPRSPSR